MTNTERIIMEVFRRFRVVINGVLPYGSFLSVSSEWSGPSNIIDDAVNALIRNGFLETRGNDFVLTERGYNYLYGHLSIDDTECEILQMFRNRRIRSDEYLPLGSIISDLENLAQFHADNCNVALLNLENKGLIRRIEHGYILQSTD